MKEAAITQSPFAFVPKADYTDEEREALYRTRLDETFRPYTIIDVLTKVYHRSFEDDLLEYIGQHTEEFKQTGDEWSVSRVWVNKLKVIRPESVFIQPVRDFQVDIVADIRIRLEEVRTLFPKTDTHYNITRTLRLRYSFNFLPCKLTCTFIGVILKEEESLLVQDPFQFPVDKYLLPILDADGYQRMATYIRLFYLTDSFGSDAPVDPARWVEEIPCRIREASFQECGVLGEYFFSFGSAELIDAESGKIRREDIDPGTIILNQELIRTRGIRNSTVAHEGTHAYLGRFFFLLQKTHGHGYCSYMSKRNEFKKEYDCRSPFERMEIQANTLPRFLMIPELAGHKHAIELLSSYPGGPTLANMQRLVDDMAEYYGTTKRMARSRLIDFGFTEVSGLLQTANGNLLPSYLSTLQKGETYTISEKTAIEEYLKNPAFAEVINTGKYLYIPENGCFCLKDDRFLFYDPFGKPHLRLYAREHMGECCLVFREEYSDTFVRLVNGVLQKGIGRGRKQIQYVGISGESPVTEEGLRLRKQIEQEIREAAAYEMNFNDMTVELMEKRGITVGKLAELTGLSEEIIKRMRNKSDIEYSIRYVTAVCIALHLPPSISASYIRVSPAKFQNTVEMKLYEYALNQWYLDDVPSVNRRLVEAGVQPLTALVDGYGEDGVKVAY